MQQAGEQVEDRYEQGHRCHDVVGLAAVNNITGVPGEILIIP